MPKAKDNYKITYDDGTEDFLQLDDEGAARWEKLAKAKGSPVKSVAKGNPKPINKAA